MTRLWGTSVKDASADLTAHIGKYNEPKRTKLTGGGNRGREGNTKQLRAAGSPSKTGGEQRIIIPTR